MKKIKFELEFPFNRKARCKTFFKKDVSIDEDILETLVELYENSKVDSYTAICMNTQNYSLYNDYQSTWHYLSDEEFELIRMKIVENYEERGL